MEQQGRTQYKYYYLPCPLCLQDIDGSPVADYRVLPVDSTYAQILNEKPQWEPVTPSSVYLNKIIVGNVKASMCQTYPSLAYTDRVWLLHTRCLRLIADLPSSVLYVLLDLVEPIFHSLSLPP